MKPYVILAATTTLTCSALANVVYDNGSYSASANSFDVQIVADDFYLESDTLLTGASIFAYGGSEMGSMDYWIFSDGINQPGGILASGNQVQVNSVIVGNAGGYGYQYRLDFDFTTPIELKAKTRYWLGAHIGEGYDGPYFRFWNFTLPSVGGNSMTSLFGTTDNWANYFNSDRAFQLNGTPIPAVPEPSPFGFVIGGIAVLAMLTAKNRKTKG